MPLRDYWLIATEGMQPGTRTGQVAAARMNYETDPSVSIVIVPTGLRAGKIETGL